MKKLMLLIGALLLVCGLFGCAEEPAHTHTLDRREALAPDCVHTGCAAHWYCTECGKYFSDEAAATEVTEASLTIAATGQHSYGEDGRCVACGKELEDTMFALNESGEAYVFLGDPTAVELTVPALHRGKPVTAIGGNAFWKNKNLKRVTLPDSITEIGANAFADCTALEGVTLGSGLTDIGQRAFAGCTALQWVSVPTASAWLSIRFESAASNPFSYADELRVGGTAVTALSVPAGVTEIGDFAFYNMSFLQSVQLPDSVTRIGDCAFYACSRLTTCTLPEGLRTVGDEAFFFCRSLGALTLPESLVVIGVAAFERCTSLSAVSFTVTEGWSCGAVALPADELELPATAATYLTATYVTEAWMRTES